MSAKPRVDQWVPALHRGDAIGDSTLRMRDALRRWGHPADVYTLSLDEDLAGEAFRFGDFRPGGPDDLVILHYALPSPLTEALRSHRGRRMLIHHNITPPEFFADYDPEMARICVAGREQLGSLADAVDLALGDSEFNRAELEAAGFRRTGVLPIYLDFDRYLEPPNPVLRRLLGDGRKNLLFVGRVSPNKRPEDLIRLAAYWKRFIEPGVRLVLVGKHPRRETGHGRPLTRHYLDALLRMSRELGLDEGEVLFTGHVDHAELLACYASAHVFVSMSEHEGFGVPLVEAMLMDVPVLAYRSTAVEHTLGRAGVQFTEKDLAPVAELAHALATDGELRRGVLASQRERLRDFGPASVEATLAAHLRMALAARA
jgi:glycosyltransferase involved in cell wall biosynthesis